MVWLLNGRHLVLACQHFGQRCDVAAGLLLLALLRCPSNRVSELPQLMPQFVLQNFVVQQLPHRAVCIEPLVPLALRSPRLKGCPQLLGAVQAPPQWLYVAAPRPPLSAFRNQYPAHLQGEVLRSERL